MFLKIPGQKRKSFAIVAYELVTRTKKTYLPLPDEIKESLDKVNEQFKAGKLNQDQAETILRERIRIAHVARNAPKVTEIHKIISDVNLTAFSSFWADLYEHKRLIDSSSSKNDFYRALVAIEPLSLHTLTEKQVLNKLKSQEISKQRRIIFRLREVLAWLKRGVKITLPDEELLEIEYISIEEMEKLRQFVPEPMNYLVAALFHTGCRLGEAMAIETNKISTKEQTILIDSQIDIKNKKRSPKRKRAGRVKITGDFELVLNWAKVKDKTQYREKFQTILPQISEDKIGKRITAHDLRHSHAIYLLSKGINLSLVAKQLRNRIEVCQKYYSGYSHQDETLDAIGRALKA